MDEAADRGDRRPPGPGGPDRHLPGHPYGAPFTSNTQLLWYRDDLTPEPPETWDDAIDAAQALDDAGQPHLFQVQGERYEGLVVWFTSLVASAGTTILNDDGTEVVLAGGPPRRPSRS